MSVGVGFEWGLVAVGTVERLDCDGIVLCFSTSAERVSTGGQMATVRV
jgi:hypothetical protein